MAVHSEKHHLVEYISRVEAIPSFNAKDAFSYDSYLGFRYVRGPRVQNLPAARDDPRERRLDFRRFNHRQRPGHTAVQFTYPPNQAHVFAQPDHYQPGWYPLSSAKG